MAAAGEVVEELADPIPLPDEFLLPAEFMAADPVIVDLNLTLAGFYGAISQHVSSVRGRAETAPLARDRSSFDAETADLIKALNPMRNEAARQAEAIVAMGGIPFAMPEALTEAINEMLPVPAAAAGEEL